MIDFASVLLFATPLLLAAYGETLIQKSGVIHIGLEGAMLMSAFIAFLVGKSTNNLWLGTAAGAATGLILTLIFGFFSISLRADQVVVGTATTLFALGLSGYLFRIQFGESGQLLTFGGFPKLGGIDAVMGLALFLAPMMYWIIFQSKWGLLVRATGEYPPAIASTKRSVQAIRYQAICVGGLLAGLSGAYLSLGVAQSFAENMTSGRGFVAIALVTFGRWKPFGVLPACLLIGYLESLQFSLQSKGSGVPYQLLLALPYAVSLAVLAFGTGRTVAPSALGEPFPEAA